MDRCNAKPKLGKLQCRFTNVATVDSLSDGISYPDKQTSLTRRQAVICRQYSSLLLSCGCKTWSLNSAGGCTVQYGPDDF
jgi:hypothetical protein